MAATDGMISYAPKLAWRGLKKLQRVATKIIFKPPPRAANPYATHVPVLIGLARALKVRSVLEVGCGQYSTLTFLNRAAFPNLEKLRSLENDIEWFAKVAKLVADDPRAEMMPVSGAMSRAMAATEIDAYDLIFLDDSTSAEERAATIREVAAKQPVSTIVVIHDYEVQAYRQAARAFVNRFNFDCLAPNTGIVWNNAAINKRDLRALNTFIKRYSKHYEPDDLSGWLQVLSGR